MMDDFIALIPGLSLLLSDSHKKIESIKEDMEKTYKEDMGPEYHNEDDEYEKAVIENIVNGTYEVWGGSFDNTERRKTDVSLFCAYSENNIKAFFNELKDFEPYALSFYSAFERGVNVDVYCNTDDLTSDDDYVNELVKIGVIKALPLFPKDLRFLMMFDGKYTMTTQYDGELPGTVIITTHREKAEDGAIANLYEIFGGMKLKYKNTKSE